jgi:CheY-like chemotaxis protein
MAEKTILVVEDNEVNMKLVSTVLELGRYRVLEAVDAETGLVLTREHHPDLILMDIQLPGMDGLSATRLIKADPELQDIPVVALSGFAMEEDKEKAMSCGFSGYIVKPFIIKDILKTIANYIS